MNKNHKRFEKELKAKGYTFLTASWRPIGGNVEMIGREGGWVVEYTSDGDLNDIILGHSADEVLDAIKDLERHVE